MARGMSISAKMIVTTMGLLAFVIVLFAYLNYRNVTKVYGDSTERQRQTYEKSIKDAAAAQIIAFAEPSKAAMQEENWAAVQQFVVPIRERDPRILYIWIANSAGKIVASADEKENKRVSNKVAQNFLLDPVRKQLVPHRIIPKKPSGKVSPMRVAGKVQSFHGMRVMVNAERLISQGVYVGAVVLVYSLKQLDDMVGKLTRRKVRESRKAFIRTAMVGALFLLVGALLAIVQGVSISRPVKRLADSAALIARGDLESRVAVNTGGELGLLAQNFNFMADQLVVLLHETATKATMEKELEVARTIQEALVPSNEVVDKNGVLQLAGFFEPATECGGDWWSFFDIVDDKVLIIIGDVTGHGVPSAMITATAKSAVDTLRFVKDNSLSVTYLMEILNKAIYESAKRQFVMTCFVTVVDLKALTITYANAGHNFPYLYREVDGKGRFSVLMKRGNRLGDLVESTYESKTEKVQPGDILVWYTDGIVECENERGEEYGEKRFRAAIRRARNETVGPLRDAVVHEANEFFGSMPRKDDITMVVGRIYAPGEAPSVPRKRQAEDADLQGSESTQGAESPTGKDGNGESSDATA
ncbi:MAG: SpoIIE family protein phosphatase [Deltaproteobacteria bacterium]|nr:SpoIIE family protein phosphatase [Deltaproteobacteria bacterium]